MERADFGEGQEKKSLLESLYEAAIKGNANDLNEIFQKCPMILDQVTSDCVAKDNHPLYMGAMFGHVKFVTEILNRKPELTREINSKGLSPLHVASEKGHIEVVKLLLDIDADVCFLRDADGKTPLHLAAMKGRVEVLKELVRAKRISAWIFTEQREPILHICAKQRQFEALKMLVDFVQEEEFVYLKDSDDNTILHVLTAMVEVEVIKYLMNKKPGLDVINSMNVHGSTAMDVLEERYQGKPTKKIRKLLRSAKAKQAKEISPSLQSGPHARSLELTPKSNKNTWTEIGEGLIVVAILIATVTFQSMTNPPGGFWQEDSDHIKCMNRNGTFSNASHIAGTTIMAYKFPAHYYTFKTFNTIGFIASLILIVLLVSRYSLKERASVWTLTLMTWIAVVSMFISYAMVTSLGEVQSLVCDPEFYLSTPLVLLGAVVELSVFVLVVASIGPLCGFLKKLPQRIKCLFRNYRYSDFHNTSGDTDP